MVKIVACVLAGGAGKRLYPATDVQPKPLLTIEGTSLLETTLERVAFADERYVLCGPNQADAIREHVSTPVIVEPARKDTGPALVYAAWRLRNEADDAVLLTLPCDHHVGDEAAFTTALERAVAVAAETDGLVTLGVEPTRPATGYGYVVPAGASSETTTCSYAPVERFVEKPDRETARDLLERGAVWNAGIFAWTPAALLRAARNSPLAPLLEALERDDPPGGFEAVESISVDYAVLENEPAMYVTPLSTPWDDLGTWDALGRALENDSPDGENARLDSGELLEIDARRNVVAAPDAHVSLVGVEDLVVAAYDDRILVAPREQSQEIRRVVDRLSKTDE